MTPAGPPTNKTFSAGVERPSADAVRNGGNAPAISSSVAPPSSTAPARKTVRPFDVDGLRFPTMRELEAAERAAVALGDLRRARAYRLVRARRLRQAQAGRLS